MSERPEDHSIDTVAVVVPARNEVDRIESALASVHHAVRHLPPDGPEVRVVIVDDASSDGTAACATRALERLAVDHTVASCVAGAASRARQVGVDLVMASVTRWDRCWLLSTDADTRVARDWILRHLAHAADGALAVAGIVDLIDDEDASDFLGRWRSDYGATLDGSGSHPHVHAANLGVRLDVLVRAGGFGELERAEDLDLWRRIRAIGIEPVADTGIVVETSGRRLGRVAAGFAHALASLYPAGAGS